VRVFGKAPPHVSDEPKSKAEPVKVAAAPTPAPAEQKRGFFSFLKRIVR
jgi:hypothetical protein